MAAGVEGVLGSGLLETPGWSNVWHRPLTALRRERLFERSALVYRTHDTELLNRIANSSAVLPFIREGYGEADWSSAATSNDVILLTDGEKAIGAFVQTTPDIFQCHWLFGEECRGRSALNLCHDMVEWMRDYGAKILWGTTPLDNRKALWFNRRMGAVPKWHDEAEQVFEYRMDS